MSVRIKLLVLVLFVGIVPLIVLTLTTIRQQQGATERLVAALHQATSRSAALRVQTALEAEQRQAELLGGQTIRWQELGPDERRGALWLVYRQLEDAVAVVLLDADGRPVGPAAYVDAAYAAKAEPGRLVGTPELVARLTDAFVTTPATRGRAVLGTVEPGPEAPIAPLVLGVEGAGGQPWKLGVALSLRRLCAGVVRPANEPIEALLLDAGGRVLCPSAQGAPRPFGTGLPAAAQGADELVAYRDDTGRAMLAVRSPLPSGWALVTRQPAETAFAATRALGHQALLWIAVSLLIALAAGSYLARGISQPIRRLVAGVEAFARGEFGHRLGRRERDEFGRLAGAFDRMGEEIEVRDAAIRAWNEELQQRVDERSRELELALRRLEQSRRIAALGSLGAAVAHEINPPLTSVLGITQLVQQRLAAEPARAKEAELLRQAADEAQRMRRVVKRLLGLSQTIAERQMASIDVHDLLDATLRLAEESGVLASGQIAREYAAEPLAIRGAFSPLQQAMLQILGNASEASPAAGRVVVRTTADEISVRIAVRDDGKGIDPAHLGRIFEPFFTTKPAEQGGGLGLAIARRIVEEHHGTIMAESEVGVGTTVTLVLPRIRSAAGGPPGRAADEPPPSRGSP
jgi:two-component system NtrC family sensor kinase